jgi:site-specific recombinase XerC
MGFDDPCRYEIVRSVMRGLKRQIGTAQKQATPLLREDLLSVLELIGTRPKDIRDRAQLLLGFAGAFRRSELVSLDVEDIEYAKQGLIVNLRKSKTDQTGKGRKIGVPCGRTRWRRVKHLKNCSVWDINPTAGKCQELPHSV